MKNYNGEVFRDRSLKFNFIFMIAMFTITQIIGVVICFKYGNMNMFLDTAIMFILNFILYKVLF